MFRLQPTPEETSLHTILTFPHMWQDSESATAATLAKQLFPQHSHRYLLALSGAHDAASPTGTLFPACMHSRFHGVRPTIEAHNRTPEATGVGGAELQAAEGVVGIVIHVSLTPSASAVIAMRVTAAQGKQAQ